MKIRGYPECDSSILRRDEADPIASRTLSSNYYYYFLFFLIIIYYQLLILAMFHCYSLHNGNKLTIICILVYASTSKTDFCLISAISHNEILKICNVMVFPYNLSALQFYPSLNHLHTIKKAE